MIFTFLCTFVQPQLFCSKSTLTTYHFSFKPLTIKPNQLKAQSLYMLKKNNENQLLNIKICVEIIPICLTVFSVGLSLSFTATPEKKQLMCQYLHAFISLHRIDSLLKLSMMFEPSV